MFYLVASLAPGGLPR